MRKFICAVLTLALIISFIPGMTITASAATEGDWDYRVSNGEATVRWYTGPGGNVVIPSTLGGYPVTTVGVPGLGMFNSLSVHTNTTVTSVIIPNGVTTIGARAFRGCTSLVNVTVL
jgi:hypothetical protein